MSSKGAGGAPLPLHAHSPSPATGRTRRRMTSFLAVAILVFLALSRTTSSQLLFPVNNAQLPFDLSHTHDADRAVIPTGGGELWSEKRSPRIAIIGGGAAGSSAAYFLSHFGGLGRGLETEVTVFEKADYIGGRSTVVYPWLDDPETAPGELGDNDDDFEGPVECGASIFVDANKNLHKAARVFNLTLVEQGGEEGGMAIYDGEHFVFEEGKGWGWGYWDIAKMFWRYGRSPLTVRNLVKKTVSSFIALYSPAFAAQGPFDSLANFADATNLSHPASFFAKEYFDTNGVSPLFTSELVAAATQVNYGTPVANIHGVGALVSLAATGAVAVKGGNRQIFENFLGASGATLRLGKDARVTEVLKLDAPTGKRSTWVVRTATGGGTFDAVVFAAPFHQTSIRVLGSSPVASVIPHQLYVRLHVSFIITNASTPRPEYFNLPSGKQAPKAVFGTFDSDSATKPAFNSLNYLKVLRPETGAKFGDGTWHVVKMFSAQKLDDSLLNDVFGLANVGKVWERVFLAYPQLKPIRSEKDLAPVRPAESFYYVSGFERLISTMETETVASFNSVSLLLRDFFNYTSPGSWAEWET